MPGSPWQLRDDGVALEHVDLGGGLGVAYDGRPTITPADYAAAVLPALAPLRPARGARAGTRHGGRTRARWWRGSWTRSRYPDGRRFAVLDAGMTELMRPALYGSYHRIVPVDAARRSGVAPGTWSARSARAATCSPATGSCPTLQVDDLVALLDTGAYGAVMASNYNRRLLAPEVLVDDGAWTVIRRRQTIDDVLALESC